LLTVGGHVTFGRIGIELNLDLVPGLAHRHPAAGILDEMEGTLDAARTVGIPNACATNSKPKRSPKAAMIVMADSVPPDGFGNFPL
jgi:hypothetical protein